MSEEEYSADYGISLATNFFDFVKEREHIRRRRADNQPPPWTSDPVLRAYKFTNVKRLHDRTTQFLKLNFYDRYRNQPPEQYLINAATFRYFGTSEFANAVGWTEQFSADRLVQIARERFSKKLRVFTGAYVITNQGLKADKEIVVAHHFLSELWDRRDTVLHAIATTKSWRLVAEQMSVITGFGGTGFMTKEVLLDTMLTPLWGEENNFLPADYNQWTPVGPGGIRGTARVLGYAADTKIHKRTVLETIRNLWELQEKYWLPVFPDMPLDLTDIQFQLCEFDKYMRVLNFEGRPRSLFNATLRSLDKCED